VVGGGGGATAPAKKASKPAVRTSPSLCMLLPFVCPVCRCFPYVTFIYLVCPPSLPRSLTYFSFPVYALYVYVSLMLHLSTSCALLPSLRPSHPPSLLLFSLSKTG
jgi:hypothetical protein